MSSSENGLKLPPQRDYGFYQRRKHDKWREVSAPEPPLESPIADSHAHVHLLPDPAWELARCAENDVDFVCLVTDPSEDGSRPFDELDAWLEAARRPELPQRHKTPIATTVRIAVGIHPHNAKLYDDTIEQTLLRRLEDERVGALGEIGLDYHYDFSPREVQREVFRRQIVLAEDVGLPIALHLRSGEDPERDNAHAEAFAILQETGFPSAGTLLHCCALSPDELRPWVDADCYIAYGGALTFKKADEARAGAMIVPVDRLMLETDSPYMTPEPMRGSTCTPAHVIFTAQALAELRDVDPGEDRRAFLDRIHANTVRFYGRKAIDAGRFKADTAREEGIVE